MRKTRVLALSIISGFSAIALTSSTIAWFAIGTHISFGTDTNDVKARLQKLNELHDQGLISDEDYEKKKKDIIDSL